MLTVITATIPGREQRLAKAMASVAAQTHPIKQHLISCRAPYGASPPHQAAQLNTCLHAATSEWVAVLDDDNEWLPDHAMILLSFATTTHADVVYSFDVRHTPPRLPRENVNGWSRELLLATLAERNPIDGGAAIIRRSLLIDVGGFPTNWEGGPLSEGGHYPSGANYADWETWNRLVRSGAAFFCVPASTWSYNTDVPLRMQTGLG